jgi:PfaD family protein
VGHPVFIIDNDGTVAVSQEGRARIGSEATNRSESSRSLPLLGYLPPSMPADLGDPLFKARYGLTYAYVAGAMANGITSVEMVEAVGKNGMIGFFGAAGLPLDRIESAIDRIQNTMADRPYGFNLIHSPYEPDLEAATVDLYLRRGIRCISASAYLRLTLPLVAFRVSGIHRDREGRITCPNRVLAKVSRIEVAERFFSPPPQKMLSELVRTGTISPEEAELASQIPVAADLTAEADSGGHTDNRPAMTLLPTMTALRDRIVTRHRYAEPVCVGLGGGIATPAAAAGAFAMGAAYILTGTVNQACIEAGTSETVRQMLAEASQADVAMAPSADMFEMGVKVQVLKRGTMFPQKAQKLYDLYRQHHNWESIEIKDKQIVESQYFKRNFNEEWAETRQFFKTRDPGQILKAETDPRHKMALVFRAYLGKSSKWANSGEPSRQIDYQIWCGPAIGAFNEWTKGSFLESPPNRSVVTVAMNLMLGAAILTRLNLARVQHLDLGIGTEWVRPQPLSRIMSLIDDRAP